MSGKTIGVIVLAIAIALVVIGIRGTQNNIFSFLPTPGGGITGTPANTNQVPSKSDATGGVTGAGAGYTTSSASSQKQCNAEGGVWYNGQCRHFTGAGANK